MIKLVYNIYMVQLGTAFHGQMLCFFRVPLVVQSWSCMGEPVAGNRACCVQCRLVCLPRAWGVTRHLMSAISRPKGGRKCRTSSLSVVLGRSEITTGHDSSCASTGFLSELPPCAPAP